MHTNSRLLLQELLYELAHRPDIQTRLHDELVRFEEQHGRAPEYSDLVSTGNAGLDYLEAVTLETLRLKAVLMDIAREVCFPLPSYAIFRCMLTSPHRP
jgi:cytochrome P450